MSESESDALPLGDTPIFGTDVIIANPEIFVKGFFEKSFVERKFLAKTLSSVPLCGIISPLRVQLIPAGIKFLPVAQLDSASDSDSEGRRFESFRVGQNKNPPCAGFLFWLITKIRTERNQKTVFRESGVYPLIFFPCRLRRHRESLSGRLKQKPALCGFLFWLITRIRTERNQKTVFRESGVYPLIFFPCRLRRHRESLSGRPKRGTARCLFFWPTLWKEACVLCL